MEPCTIWTSGTDWRLHHTLRTYWLTTLATLEVGLDLRVSGTSHRIMVNLSLPVEVVQLKPSQEVFDVSRLLYPLCPGQETVD